ncbi:signal recognition particle receptor protein [Striga asiatica]|uniref:Signal recognition particle receptor protein n=1 Tax=Striga asiatica TaxID=4170 RepID=A0A5A7QR45_STRAF|nr:signal recognition particle receptor protein [Striga asiatica]
MGGAESNEEKKKRVEVLMCGYFPRATSQRPRFVEGRLRRRFRLRPIARESPVIEELLESGRPSQAMKKHRCYHSIAFRKPACAYRVFVRSEEKTRAGPENLDKGRHFGRR